MKTAQQFINDFQDEFRENGGGVVEQLMIEYAREAIKADRENVAKHAKTEFMSTWNQPFTGIQPEIDKNSILNAPQIELL